MWRKEVSQKIESLDVGCGFNPQTHRKKGDIGVDLKKGMCDIVASVYGLPFKEKVFGKVIMSHVLEHLRNLGDALNEVRRVLTTNGTLEVEVPNAGAFWIFKDSVLRRKPKLCGFSCCKEHICSFGGSELQNLMRETGFQTISIEYVTSSKAKNRMQKSFIRKLFYKILFQFFPIFQNCLKITVRLRQTKR